MVTDNPNGKNAGRLYDDILHRLKNDLAITGGAEAMASNLVEAIEHPAETAEESRKRIRSIFSEIGSPLEETYLQMARRNAEKKRASTPAR